MTDTCPKCGRPQGSALNREPGPWFRCEAHIGDEIDAAYCDQVAAAYQRGRRDGIDEGVRIAKEHVVTCCLDCRWTQAGTDESGPFWGYVDAEAEKAKGE